MFFDSPNTEVYKKKMSLEGFIEAAMPEEAQELLAGKMPEMTLEGIRLDTAAFDTFRQHMVAVGTRVAKEKKAFQAAKKWLKDQFDSQVSQDIARRTQQTREKENRKKVITDVTVTLLFVAVFALFFWYAKVFLPENPMTALRFISSGWLKALGIIITAICVFATWYVTSNSEYKNFSHNIKFLASLTGIVSIVFLFISLNTVATGTYDISTRQEMLSARHFPVGSSFTLRGDVDMEGKKVKYLFREFEGTFDGNGYTISNIEIKESNKAGLFRSNNGTIKNLTASDITVHWKAKKNYSGSHYNFQVGVLVSYNDASGNVKDCTVKDSQFVIQGDKPTSAQATEYQYAKSDNCMGAVIGHNSYSGEYSGLKFENVTADFYMIRSAISGPYMPSVGYNSN